jgi:hypothetical protein
MLFIEEAERARPATPAVVLEHPDHLRIQAEQEGLRQLLAELLRVGIAAALHRAEIRLELGARPGCSFHLRDNGHGQAHDLGHAASVAARIGATLWQEHEAGWGCTIRVLLAGSPADDDVSAGPYTGPVPLR